MKQVNRSGEEFYRYLEIKNVKYPLWFRGGVMRTLDKATGQLAVAGAGDVNGDGVIEYDEGEWWGRVQMDDYCLGEGANLLVCKFLVLPEDAGGDRFANDYPATWLTTATSPRSCRPAKSSIAPLSIKMA